MPSSITSSDGDNDTLIDFEPCDENTPDASLKNAMKLAWADRANTDLRATVKGLKMKIRALEADNELLRLRNQEVEAVNAAAPKKKNNEVEREHEREKLQSEIQNTREDRDWHMAQHNRILKEKSATTELMNTYSNAMSHVEDEVKTLRVENEALKSKNTELGKTVEDLRSENKDIQEKRERLRSKAKSMVAEKDTIIESLTKDKSSLESLAAQTEQLKREKKEMANVVASIVVDLDIVHSGYRVWTCTHPGGVESISYQDRFRAGPFRTSYLVKELWKRVRYDSDFIDAYSNRQSYHEDHAFYHEKAGHRCPSFNTGVSEASYAEIEELFTQMSAARAVTAL